MFFKGKFSKKSSKRIFSTMAGKLDLNFCNKIENSNSTFPPLDYRFFGGFLRKIRLYCKPTLIVANNVGYDKFISRFPISNFICCVEMNKGYIRRMKWRYVLLSHIKLRLKNIKGASENRRNVKRNFSIVRIGRFLPFWHVRTQKICGISWVII